MKKRYLLMIIGILMIFLIIGYSKNNSEDTVKPISNENRNSENKFKISKLQKKIDLLEKENNKMEVKIANMKKEKDNFNKLSHLSVEFVNAQIKGDTNKLKEMISEEVEWKYVPYAKDNSDGQYEYMVIQSYEYAPEDDIYKINIKESYAEIPGEVENILKFQYLDLHFKKINDEWKIVYLVLQP